MNIFDQAIPDDLLQSQILNDSTLQKAESLQKETKNQEISLESFSRFLIKKGYSIRYNELLNIVEYDGIPESIGINDFQNVTPVQLQYEYKKYTKRSVTKHQVTDLIMREADIHSYNPIQDYLKGIVWDGKAVFLKCSVSLVWQIHLNKF